MTELAEKQKEKQQLPPWPGPVDYRNLPKRGTPKPALEVKTFQMSLNSPPKRKQKPGPQSSLSWKTANTKKKKTPRCETLRPQPSDLFSSTACGGGPRGTPTARSDSIRPARPCSSRPTRRTPGAGERGLAGCGEGQGWVQFGSARDFAHCASREEPWRSDAGGNDTAGCGGQAWTRDHASSLRMCWFYVYYTP